MGLPAVTFGLALSGWIWFLRADNPEGGPQHADFRQLYTAGYMVRTGHRRQLYDYAAELEFQHKLVSQQAYILPFYRPAYEALVLSPLSFLSLVHAFWVMVGLNAVFLTLTFLALKSCMGTVARVGNWLPPVIFVSYYPVMVAIMRGQDTILLLFLLAAAYACLSRGLSVRAGILTGLGLFKFHLTLPLAFLFLIWRRWRFFAAFAMTALLLAGLSVWLTGIAQATLYVHELRYLAQGSLSANLLARYAIVRQETMPNLHGLVFGMARGRIPQDWIEILTLTVSILVLGWTAIRGRHVKHVGGLLLYAMIACSLVGHYLLIQDLAVLLLPVVVILDSCLPSEAYNDKTGRLINRAAVCAFIAPAILWVFVLDHFFWMSVLIVFLWLAADAWLTSWKPMADCSALASYGVPKAGAE